MTGKLEVYQCEVCGNMVEVLQVGKGTLVCCGQSMVLQKENKKEASLEKHIPVIEPTAGGFRVSVGSLPHPMEEKHFIEWIELVADGKAYRQFLNPGETPQAFFTLEAKKIAARAFCNLHGMWKSS
jgi:superoxide reductase